MSAVSEHRGDDDGGDRDHRDAEHAADPVDLALQRRPLLLGTAEQAGDVAHLGRHAGRRHHRPPAPARDGRAVEDHVHAVAEPAGSESAATSFSTASLSPVSDASATVSDAASTSRASALTASPSARSRTSPGTISVAGTRCSRPSRTTLAVDRRHTLQSGDRLLGARLLDVAEHGVEDDDHGDHKRVIRHALGPLGDPRDRDTTTAASSR